MATLRPLVERHLTACGFPSTPGLIDDVLDEVRLLLVRPIIEDPSLPHEPAARVERTVVAVIDDLSRPGHASRLQHHVRRSGRGTTMGADCEPVAPVGHAEVVEGPMADMIRSALPGTGAQPWATSAALAYLVLLEDPKVVVLDVPTPPEGTDVDRERAWSALWCSGSEYLFTEPCSAPMTLRREHAVDRLVGLIDELITRCRLLHGLVTEDRDGLRRDGLASDNDVRDHDDLHNGGGTRG